MTPLETLSIERALPVGISSAGVPDLRAAVSQMRRLERLSAHRSSAQAYFNTLTLKERNRFCAAWCATQKTVEDHLAAREGRSGRRTKKGPHLTGYEVEHSVARVRDTFYALMMHRRTADQCSAYALSQWGYATPNH